jgi:penicillin-binding protein 1A
MGRVLERNFPIKTKVLDEQTVYVMDWVLKKVVAHGTGMRARIKGYPIAGKTGTTNNFTDAWFLGFTPNYVGAVFLGNDDPSVSLGYNKTGGAIAAPLWRKAMKPILTREVPIDFKMPTDIKFLNIDRAAGTLTTSQTQKVIKLPFVEGTEIAIKKKEKREDILWNNLKGIQWIK